MQPVFFIADLHLCPQRPETNQYFEDFIREIFMPRSNILYILGDLFEYWIGDDGAETLGYSRQLELLTELTDLNKDVYFMHGNRDFLVGSTFSETTGVKILNDPTKIDIAGKTCLLKHGDDLCSDDVEHQKFRLMTRDAAWQHGVLSKSIEERLVMASQMRQMSGSSYKPSEIMDVNENTVAQQFIDENIDILIHGHTHRPATHDYRINEDQKQRIVLGDWHQGISYLKIDHGGFELVRP